MIKLLQKLLLVCLATCPYVSGADTIHSIRVFTIPQYAIQTSGFKAKVCDLTSFDHYKAVLNNDIKSLENPDNIKAIVRLRSPQISQAYLCLVKAKELGITKVPAIVINDRFVSYGVTQVRDAVLQFEQQQRVAGS